MDYYWIWAILLLVLGAGLALLEVFFPSAGILGTLSFLSFLAAVVMGFYQGPIVGFLIILGVVVGLPILIALGFKYWPHTRIGKRILLTAPTADDFLPDDPEKQRLKGLIGRKGKAKSKMLLSGVVVIDGKNVDAVSESMPIEPGQPIQVVRARGNRVVVRPIEEEPSVEPPADPLQQTFEDPFDLPPA